LVALAHAGFVAPVAGLRVCALEILSFHNSDDEPKTRGCVVDVTAGIAAARIVILQMPIPKFNYHSRQQRNDT
jgi:hypothetical protein